MNPGEPGFVLSFSVAWKGTNNVVCPLVADDANHKHAQANSPIAR